MNDNITIVYLEDTILTPPVICTIGTSDKLKAYEDWLHESFSNDVIYMKILTEIYSKHKKNSIVIKTRNLQYMSFIPILFNYMDSISQVLTELEYLFGYTSFNS